MVLEGPCAVPGCPDRTNASGQWQLIPEIGLTALGLEFGMNLQTCKKADCRRAAKIIPDKQKPGRKRKADDVPYVEGRAVGRLPPLFLERIIQIKGRRFVPPALQCTMRLSDSLHSHVAPACLLVVRRYDAADCEKATTDETVLEARRNKVSVPLATAVQYKVHGWFKNKPADAGWGDTYFLSMQELSECAPAFEPRARRFAPTLANLMVPHA